MGLVNHLENPKQWAIAHENGKFLVMPLKHVLSVMGHVNPPKPQTMGNSSQKLPKTQKLRVFGHAYQTSTKCHGLENPLKT
jgi:hypothetical protein